MFRKKKVCSFQMIPQKMIELQEFEALLPKNYLVYITFG